MRRTADDHRWGGAAKAASSGVVVAAACGDLPEPVVRRIEGAQVSGRTGPSLEQRQLQALRLLKRELEGLELQTIVLGRRPVAVINGEILQPGQRFGSFTVAKIGKISVLLEAQGKRFEIKMNSDSSGTSSRRPRR